MIEISTLIEALGIVITLFAALFVGRQTYAHFIRNRAFAYIERFNHKDFMELRIALEKWLAQNPRVDSFRLMLASKEPEEIEISVKIRTFLNLFQELAVAFEKGMVDKNIFYYNFDFLITSHWDRFEEFIFAYRAYTGDYTIYKRFEWMAKEVKRHRRTFSSRRIFVFGYGSLLIQESIHATLKRPSASYTLHPATIQGYRREWNLTVPLFSEALQKPILGIFLNIIKEKDASTQGVIFEVSEEELGLLRQREINYDCLEVTPYIQSSLALEPEDVVVTFVGQERHYLGQSSDAYVLERYLGIVQKANDSTLLDIGSLPRLDGAYRFSSS